MPQVPFSQYMNPIIGRLFGVGVLIGTAIIHGFGHLEAIQVIKKKKKLFNIF